VLHNYGTKQNGQVNWKGMVISAKHQQPVKAVYPGTVVFAEYLRGYGLYSSNLKMLGSARINWFSGKTPI
jgi:murein DD-endopeptidase MepM/ murein hydrolase activator NlpD